MKATLLRVLAVVLSLLALLLLIPSGSLVSANAEEAANSTIAPLIVPTAPPPVQLSESAADLPLDAKTSYTPNADNYLSEWEYQDETISVRILKDRAFDTDYLVAYVQIAGPTQLRTAVAGKHNSEDTLRGAHIAKRVGAVLAINGDYYSYRSGGYIIRQGKQYRNQPNKLDVLLIDANGDLHVVEYATRDDIEAYLKTMDAEVVNSFAFGPLLVRDGKRVDEVHYFDVGTVKKAQRMAIAQTGPLSYMCVSTEGPEDKGSQGLTVDEFATLMEALGCDIAYNLDGGSSNTMAFRNEKINSPLNPKERYIFDILYFATAVEPVP